MKKSWLFLLGLLSLLVFGGCEVGMGSAVDLEAPVLTITSPEKFSYQKLKFSLTGTCTDNLKVEKVVVTDKETGRLFGEAVITGETWRLDLDLKKEDEGEITFLCEAIDPKHNTSTHSARSITLLVDEHAPEAKSWYVDRGNSIQTQLESKEFLAGLDFNLSRNKNYPQNEKFTLYGDFYDAMGIDTITVKLFEDDELIIEKTVNASESSPNYIGSGKSIFSPSFYFEHDDLVAQKASLASGKHYLRVVYYAKDNDDPVNYNAQTRDMGKYILWYPESDYPGVQQVNVKADGKINASVGSSIPVDFFDDDGLVEIRCALRTSITGTAANYAVTLRDNESTRNTAFSNYNNANGETGKTDTGLNNLMDYPVTITAPEIPGQMYLLAAAKDLNGNWNARVIPVEVTDSNKPMLFVESPTENETPVMNSGSDRLFSFKGYSLDTKGADYIKIAYDPVNDTDREKRAKALLDSDDSSTDTKRVVSGTNQVIWYYKFTGDGSNYAEQNFDIKMNLFEDFNNAAGVSTAKDTKFFEILLVDTDGNRVYKPFILEGDIGSPLIEIKTPVKELDIHDYTKSDLVIKFKGYKNSNIGMESKLYKITTKIGDSNKKYVSVNAPSTELSGAESQKITAPDGEGFVTLTIPKATLATWAETDAQPTFTFYATDILGNGGKGEDMRSVILSPRPVINAITVDKNNETYKAGDVLTFKVSFSKQVKIGGTSNPRLVLSNITGISDDDKYATYDTGDMTNALTFKWTVPENAVSSGIVCDGFDLDLSIDPVTHLPKENVLANGATIHATELGEGYIYTSLTNAEVLKDKVIKLDGVAPVINNNGLSVTADDGNSYCTKDKIITAVLTMSESVLVSGSPELILKSSASGSPDVKFNFQKMEMDDENEDYKLFFTHTVKNSETNKTPEGLIKYNLASCFSSTHKGYIKDKVGNELVLTNTQSGDTTVTVDYTPPTNAPSISSPTANSSPYSTAQQIILTASTIESGATAYYSYDGGVSWKPYNSANPYSLGTGTYQLRTYQTDRAGNKSSESNAYTVTINTLFPSVTNFAIETPDGTYGAGSEIPFVLDFSAPIVVNNASDLVLEFKNKGGTVTRTCNVTVSGNNKASRLTFNYTVQATDDIKGVVVTKITFADSVRDAEGHAPAFNETSKILTTTNCPMLGEKDSGKRESVNLDGVAPVISTYVPANGGISSITDNSSGSFKITLTFSENVSKETGYIILQRKGDWAIPAVMTNDEFLKYYNKMSAANKAIVRRMGSDGDDLKHGRTGIEVGPYRRITHGLKLNDAETVYVPDDSTKFVLAYDLGLYDGSAALNDGTETGTFNVTVAQIRAALESVGYHQHKVDVASEYVKITGNKVEITFSEKIEDGREWELIIPDTAFRDDAENFYKGMNITGSTDTYSLWSNNVAQPVVRVDRYTHGWGAKEPNSDGTFTIVTVNNGKFNESISANSSAAVAPTGYVRARIDCETPGATIKYSKLGINGTAWTDTPPAGVEYNAASGTAQNSDYHTSSRHVLDDITKANLEKRGATDYTQGNDRIIGDGTYTSARKDYITAYATKTGYTDSKNGFEGAFKTIVYVKSNQTVAALNVEGGTAPGGQPNVFGFPLRDATDEDEPNTAGRYSKNMYAIDGNTRKNFVFVSYEIISEDWAILLCGTNHARSYPLNSYGGSAYITKQNFWTGTNVQ